MKKKTKKSSKKSDTGPYHLLMYVLNSSPKLKRFYAMEEMEIFINKFHKKYPEVEAASSGYWIDFIVTNISGDVHFFTDGISVT